MIGKVKEKQRSWEKRGWRRLCYLPGCRRTLKPQRDCNSARATGHKGGGKQREAVAVRRSRKSFCNCPQRKRKAEKVRRLWSAVLRGGEICTDDAEKAEVFSAFLLQNSLQRTSATRYHPSDKALG